MNNPLLSIVVPVYNVEKFVDKTFSSIYNQGFPEHLYEVVVVNDGTPDNSMDIILQYKDHKNLRIIEQTNQGLSAARNAGLNVATGEYVWFVDSDDWLLSGSLDKIYAAICENVDVDVFSTVLMLVYETTGVSKKEYDPLRGVISGKSYLKNKYRQGAAQRFIVKRSFLINNKLYFFPGILHEDSLWGFQMLYLARVVFVLSPVVYAYRLRDNGSIMSDITVRSAYDLLKIHKLLVEFEDVKVSSNDKSWYRVAIFNIIDCIYGFCRQILSTKEFEIFYKKNEGYLFSESKILLNSSFVSKVYAYRMMYCPIFYMKLRYKLGLLKKKCRI